MQEQNYLNRERKILAFITKYIFFQGKEIRVGLTPFQEQILKTLEQNEYGTRYSESNIKKYSSPALILDEAQLVNQNTEHSPVDFAHNIAIFNQYNIEDVGLMTDYAALVASAALELSRIQLDLSEKTITLNNKITDILQQLRITQSNVDTRAKQERDTHTVV